MNTNANANNNSALKGIVVAGAVAFVCALVVSLAAVNLRPLQEANRQAERQARIQAIVAAIPGFGELAQAGTARAAVIELGTARIDASADPGSLDVEGQLKDDARSIAIPVADDIAGLKRRENRQALYVIESSQGQVAAVIVPVRGLGYASVIKGYVALAGDARTILGVEFYEHGETPGLGARIDDPAWKAQWAGKQAFDDAGTPIIEVVKGEARTDTQVDAITGATRTSDAVGNAVRFWLGPLGFGPYLAKMRKDAS